MVREGNIYKHYFLDNIITYLNDVLAKEKNRVGFYALEKRIEETLYIMREFSLDEDTRYFDVFHNSFMDIYISDRMCSFHNSIFLNRIFHSYFINLYLIMKGYKKCKESNDLEGFKALVDDINPIDIEDYYLDSSSFDCIRKEFYLSLCEKLICFNNYKDMINLRKMVRKMISFEEDENDLDKINILISLNDTDKEVVEALLSEKKCFYSDLVKDRNRFFYINDKLEVSIENKRIRKDVFMMISNLDDNLFLEEDSFKKIMDIVFDSDSYDELLRKLLFLTNNAGSVEDNFLSRLKSIKDVYLGKEVKYPFDLSFINIVNKPTSIIERMKKSYFHINNDISLEEIDSIYENSNDIYGLIYQINYIYKNINGLEEDFHKEKKKVKEKRFWSVLKK